MKVIRHFATHRVHTGVVYQTSQAGRRIESLLVSSVVGNKRQANDPRKGCCRGYCRLSQFVENEIHRFGSKHDPINALGSFKNELDSAQCGNF